MTLTVTHAKVAVIPDDGTSEVGSDEWNAAHTLSGTLSAAQMPALTGDVTTPGASLATTLATVNGNVGTYGSATAAPVITVNAKGLVTAASSTTIRETLSADRNYYVRYPVGTFTIAGNPAVVTCANHGLSIGDRIAFSTTGILPGSFVLPGYPMLVGTNGFTANTFQPVFAPAFTGDATTGSNTGTHTLWSGNDANDGLSATSGHALWSIQAAVDLVCNKLDLNNHDVTINCPGAYYENIILSTYLGLTKTVDASWNFLTGVKILGNRSTLVPIQAISSGANVFSAVDNKTPWIIDGFTISRSAVGGFFDALHQANKTPLYIGKVDFGECGLGQHMFGDIRTTEDYTISGGAQTHRATWQGDSLYVDSPNYFTINCTISNSPTFTVAFYSVEFAQMDCYGVTYSGAVTNTKRMQAVGNGWINTYGTGETYAPGAIAATTATGGVIG